jgi:putative permease
MDIVRNWFRRHLANPQVVILALMLFFGAVFVIFAAGTLAPALASVILAYLLERPVQFLRRLGLPHLASVLVVFTLFLAMLLGVFFMLLPLLGQQISQLIQQLPVMIGRVQEALLRLPERYPGFIGEDQVRELIGLLRSDLLLLGQNLLSVSLASLRTLATLVVYLVLMPILVFFFLKDKESILAWIVTFLPKDRPLVQQVWNDVKAKIGSYVRGKAYQVIIVAVIACIVFMLLGLRFAVLVGTLTGLSVLVPVIGGAVMSVPVALIAFFQFGWTMEFIWILIAYGTIHLLDGNLLAPLLFSEVVDLHPTAIIVAILVFGGLFGFWGVFFAIPLATLVKAVLDAWPRMPPPVHS